ncbi:MAG: hypothetical protein K2Q12_08390 [Rickettsiales bacterium]|nr:hypothetical protein [Rickettsiales bacterium]
MFKINATVVPRASREECNEKLAEALPIIKKSLDKLTQKLAEELQTKKGVIAIRYIAASLRNALDVCSLSRMSMANRIGFETLVDRWQELSVPMIEHTDVSGLRSIMQAQLQFRMQPPPEWMACWYEASMKKMSDPEAMMFTPSLFAITMLSMTPRADWMQQWFQAMQGHWSSLDEQAFSNTLLAVASLKVQGVPIPQQTIAEMTTELNARHITNISHLSQLYSAVQILEIPVPDWLTQAPYVLMNANQSRGRPSSLEREFFALLGSRLRAINHSVTVQKEVWSDHTCSPIDANLHLHPLAAGEKDASLWLQLDGPAHFVKDADGHQILDGQSMLQTAILKKHCGKGEDVMRLSGRDFSGDNVAAIDRVLDRLCALANVKPQVKALTEAHEAGARLPKQKWRAA